MKTLLFSILLCSLSFGQTVSLTSNEVYGQNCGMNQPVETIIINGDLNLNGFELTLKNVSLTVTGNINGPGAIDMCSNPNQNNSSVCVNGVIQNSPNLNGLTCTLSIEEFNFTKDYGYWYRVYDIQGKLLSEGVTSPNTYNELPFNQILFVKITSFKMIKIYKE